MAYNSRWILPLSTCFLLLFHTAATAQKEGFVWVFGNNGGLNFNTNPPTPFFTSMHSLEGVASVADANGSLLMYTNGVTVWNRNGIPMSNGTGLLSNVLTSASQGPLIVQDVADLNKYYIFVTSESEEHPDLYLRYNVVDMSLNGGLGDVTIKNIIIDSMVSEMLTMAGSGTCERWVISHQKERAVFHTFNVNAAGLNVIPVISATGLDGEYGIGNMKTSNSCKKIACVSSNGTPQKPATNTVQLFDFDINTGHLAYDKVVIKGSYTDSFHDQFWSTAFSPDDNKIYTTSRPVSGTLRIYQSDISQIIPINKTIATPSEAITDIKCGPDGRLYYRSSVHKLGIIPYPNLDICGLIPEALDISPGGINTCLPNDVVITNAAYNHNIVFCHNPDTLRTFVPGIQYLWSTGATDPFIVCDSPGTYWLTTTTPCGLRNDTFTITFRPLSLQLSDTFSCNGLPVLIDAGQTPNEQYLWHDGSSAAAYTATKTGKYFVTVTNGYCSLSDTAFVFIYPPLSIPLLPPDTILCEQAFPFTIAASPVFQNYTWSDAATTAGSFIADSPGKYWVTTQTICGLYTDTIDIQGCLPGSAGIKVNTDTICENHCIHFSIDSASNITSFQWSFPGGSPDSFSGPYPPDICYFSAGSYTIHLLAANAFRTLNYDTILHILPAPFPRFTDTGITAPYRSFVQLPACYPAEKIEWYKNDSLVCTGCDPLTVQAVEWQANYTCVLYNATCREECHYKVIATGIPADAWLPSAFSPNGDGKNDHFHLITDNPNISLVELSIYDRWGERLFHAQQNGTGWDGKYKGKEVEQGTYFWYLRYKVQGQSMLYVTKGEVSLVR